MTRTNAVESVRVALVCLDELDKSLATIRGTESAAQRRSYALLVGKIMDGVVDLLIRPAIDEYPDLTPPQMLAFMPGNAVARRPPPPADTSLPAMKAKSHRYHLAHSKQQRAVLDRRIASLERDLAELTRSKPKRRAKSRRASRD